jgi:preprotein translocase subunit SecY
LAVSVARSCVKHVYQQYQGTIVSCCHTILLVLFVLCFVFHQVQSDTPRATHVQMNARQLAIAAFQPGEDLDRELEQWMHTNPLVPLCEQNS